MQEQEEKCINIQNSDCKQKRGFAFSFEKYRAINLLFLLTILKIGAVLSKGPNEAVKGPK